MNVTKYKVFKPNNFNKESDIVNINGNKVTDTQRFEYCAFTGKNYLPDSYDEGLGNLFNGSVQLYRCLFDNLGKAILQGTGDEQRTDKGENNSHMEITECVFQNCSRRQPMVNSGSVTIKRSLFLNWGIPETFYIKSYGIRATKNGNVYLEDCIFLQQSFWTCLTRGNAFKDIINHLSTLRKGFGFMRAAYSDNNGSIQAKHCYKNRFWLSIENHKGNYMTKEEAEMLLIMLLRVVPTIEGYNHEPT